MTFRFSPANAPIGRTAAGDLIYPTPEFVRAMKLVQDALGGISIPLAQAQPALEDVSVAPMQSTVAPEPALQAVQLPPIPTEQAWPIGSVFVSAVATDPSQLLGFGTWTAIGAGRFPVGYLGGDPDFGTLGGTGGAKTKAISAHSGAAVADHADHTHSVTSNVTATMGTAGAGANAVVTGITNNAVTSAGASATLSHSVTQPADHTALNVLPPFLVLNFWQRTA